MKDYKQQDYVNYRIQRAKDTINEVDILIENKLWNTAVNRLYYACFYAVGALLMKDGIEFSSHSGCRQKFGQFYIQTGRISKDLGKYYSDIFEKRQKGDYNDFFDFDENSVLPLVEPSKRLIRDIESLLGA
ncbi:MAG TPA: HEPN domain-containing protein [Bacteroidales bacterium]|nr:HEPN domain-containing protein [Bacteroidales bacterium]